MLHGIKDLYGFQIGATDGDIGSVMECFFDDLSYTVRYVVVDTGKWLEDRRVLLSPISFRSIDMDRHRITTDLTTQQVRLSPHIDTHQPVSRQHETALFGHYGYTPYWTGPYLWGADPYPSLGSATVSDTTRPEPARHWNWEPTNHNDPHLRSTAAVAGYHIHATDGDLGHVEDFLVDDQAWTIRYVVVDTTNWWSGEKVMVSPSWIDKVDWASAKVYMALTKSQIKDSQVYDPDRPLEHTNAKQLYHRHYDALRSRWT